MADFTQWEQLFMELVNRARMNPLAEAAKFGINLNKDLPSGTISPTPKQVLAPNLLLGAAADGHSQHMLSVNKFDHSGIGDSDPHSRMTNAGYVFNGNWMSGENIAWDGTTGSYNQTQGIFDQHQNLFLSHGHRENMLQSQFKEFGIGSVVGPFTYNGNNYSSMMSTQNFAVSGAESFVTGVSYHDTVDDNFYGIGEAAAGRVATLYQNGSLVTQTATMAAGGYALKTSVTGAVEVVFSGGDLTVDNGVSFVMGSANVKVDSVDGDTIDANVSIELTRGSLNAHLLGIETISATGNAQANSLIGNKAANWLHGMDGDDFLFGGAGKDKLHGGVGADTLGGGKGVDRFFYAGAAEGGDTITDFNGKDYFVFDDAVFGLSVGKLKKANFWSSNSGLAHDADDRFVYNTVTDTLFFDSDGSGAQARIEIAHISHDFNLKAADILIV